MADTSRSIESLVGARIRAMRERPAMRGMTTRDLAARMAERGVKGWDPGAVSRIERGLQGIRVDQLLHVADVLDCTVADLLSTHEPVDLGAGYVVARTDALVAGDHAMPEAEAWTRFEEATEALNDVRNAWARYTAAIERVRARLRPSAPASDAIRARIITFGQGAARALVDDLRSTYADDVEHARVLGVELPSPPQERATVHANRTPALLAVADALQPERRLPLEPWADRRNP